MQPGTCLIRGALAVLLTTCLSAPSFAQSGDREGEVQTPPPEHLKAPPSPPLNAADALKTLRLPPGFEAQIVASDPLVFDPVAMTFGPDGRIWVVEMRAFMPNVDGTGEEAPIGSIAVLRDTNGDGRMDERTEFAGGFVLPRALALVGPGVLVAEPPNLWFLEDLDGDDKADRRTQVANDYGNPANPEHTANGLLWALDNWIYSANHTVRFRYDAGQWRRERTVFRGQWGITQDDLGRLYYNTNSDPLRMDVVPAEYLRRNPNLVRPQGANVQLASPQDLPVWPGRITTGVNRGYRMLREDGTLPVVTAACGPVIYRGTLFPESFSGNAFIAEPAGNLVKRVTFEQLAGVPSVRNAYAQTEFLTSTDERFRPVNLYNGPDGALYVVDMYRGIIQHRIFLTTYLRNQIKERGLEAPIGMGRIYRIVPNTAPKYARPTLASASTAQWVEALSHPQSWWRETAQRLLVEKRDLGAVPLLEKLATRGPSALARIHALWTLDGIGALEWRIVEHALRDADERVAVHAMRVAEPFFARDAKRTLTALRERAAWGEADVQRQFALSLGAAPFDLAKTSLLEVAQQRGSFAYTADAIVSSIFGHELPFIELLVRQTTDPGAHREVAHVVASASAAVLQANDASTTKALLAYLDPPRRSPDWIVDALLSGIERLIGRNAAGVARPAFIASEPVALRRLAQQEDEFGKRARTALESLRWRGLDFDPQRALATLTPEQRALYERGRRAYVTCAACHQAEGQGMEGLAPSLVGSRYVNGGPDALVRIVLNGKISDLTMPPLQSLDDQTIAAILTYVRRSWGNEADPITPAQVQWIRSQVAGRHEPWTEAELQPMN